VALGTAAPVLPGTPLLIGPAAIAFPSVAVRWRTSVALSTVLARTSVGTGASIVA
jgi:hypothetical protein